MQFTPGNAAKVMAGTKTQTRRVIKDDEMLSDVVIGRESVVRTKGHAFGWFGLITKWKAGHTYAVQPGRGKPSIGRIRLLSIRKEKLQDISTEDCIAEGIICEKEVPEIYPCDPHIAYANLWDSINPKGKRWTDNPDVWVLTFEVVP